MQKGNRAIQAALAFAGAMALATTAAAAQETERYECLRYDHVDNIHQLDESHMILEVLGGSTLYLITVEERCMRGDIRRDIMIDMGGNDGCIRTTDTVRYGRRSCGIEDFDLIETQEQLTEVLLEYRD